METPLHQTLQVKFNQTDSTLAFGHITLEDQRRTTREMLNALEQTPAALALRFLFEEIKTLARQAPSVDVQKLRSPLTFINNAHQAVQIPGSKTDQIDEIEITTEGLSLFDVNNLPNDVTVSDEELTNHIDSGLNHESSQVSIAFGQRATAKALNNLRTACPQLVSEQMSAHIDTVLAAKAEPVA